MSERICTLGIAGISVFGATRIGWSSIESTIRIHQARNKRPTPSIRSTSAREPSRVRFEAPEARCTGPSLDLGEDLRLEAAAVDGCVLAAEGKLVHLTAFPSTQEAVWPAPGGRSRRQAPRLPSR
jgi:hypothetical protein